MNDYAIRLLKLAPQVSPAHRVVCRMTDQAPVAQVRSGDRRCQSVAC